jgi:hypothetical protein
VRIGLRRKEVQQKRKEKKEGRRRKNQKLAFVFKNFRFKINENFASPEGGEGKERERQALQKKVTHARKRGR